MLVLVSQNGTSSRLELKAVSLNAVISLQPSFV